MQNIITKIQNLRMQEEVSSRTFYHGSKSEHIDKFCEPAFFINQREIADFFGNRAIGQEKIYIHEVMLNFKKTFFMNYEGSNQKMYNILKELGIDYTFNEEQYKLDKPYFKCEEISKHTRHGNDSVNTIIYIPQVQSYLKEKGYDSVLICDKLTGYTHEIWIALDANKVEFKNDEKKLKIF